ncbi:segregation and condensation protein A [Spirochaetota bacterium]
MHELDENNVVDPLEKKHEIHAGSFDGPLDLLWDLIKKSKIDITEIPISSITEQYIEYLKLMESLNVKIAVEFIWMASELLYYKSIALLPSEELDDEYFVPPLPPGLIEKLLEYKKFQKASRDLKTIFIDHNNSFSRKHDVIPEVTNEEEEYINVSLFDLLKAFADVLESQSEIELDEIVFDEILVSDRIDLLKKLFIDNEVLVFEDVLSSKASIGEVVATFLAILEMTKIGAIKIIQSRIFGDIRIMRNYTVENTS